MIDLMTAARDAFWSVMKEGVSPDLCQVLDDTPQGTQPPFLKVGTIDSEGESGKGDQLERLTVEVIAVYRGTDRGDLLAMMHAARAAIEGNRGLSSDTAHLSAPIFLKASASDASQQDGVTFVGLLNFETWAEAA